MELELGILISVLMIAAYIFSVVYRLKNRK